MQIILTSVMFKLSERERERYTARERERGWERFTESQTNTKKSGWKGKNFFKGIGRNLYFTSIETPATVHISTRVEKYHKIFFWFK